MERERDRDREVYFSVIQSQTDFKISVCVCVQFYKLQKIAYQCLQNVSGNCAAPDTARKSSRLAGESWNRW